MKRDRLSVLAVGAHPDDIEMYCSGLLALYASRGNRVGMLVCADGSAGIPGATHEEATAVRHGETLSAAEVIGAEVIWAGLPDGKFDSGIETRLKIIDLIRGFSPDVIIGHSLADYHPDHEAAGRLVHESVHLLTCSGVGILPALERHPVVLIMEAERGFGPIPDVYVDISTVIDKKIAMLEAHKSQRAANGMDDFFDIVRAAVDISRFRGLQSDVAYAEGYYYRKAWNSVLACADISWIAANRLKEQNDV